jgi:hypothetical protein
VGNGTPIPLHTALATAAGHPGTAAPVRGGGMHGRRSRRAGLHGKKARLRSRHNEHNYKGNCFHNQERIYSSIKIAYPKYRNQEVFEDPRTDIVTGWSPGIDKNYFQFRPGRENLLDDRPYLLLQ